MVKALIGTSLKTYAIVFIRYDGDQSLEELKDLVIKWTSSNNIKELTRNGNVKALGPGFNGTVWYKKHDNSNYRDVHSVVVNNLSDFESLLTRSLPVVKREQFKREANAYNEHLPKNKKRKSPRKCHYKDDGFRPEALFLCKNPDNSTIQWSVYENKKKGWSILSTSKDFGADENRTDKKGHGRKSKKNDGE